MIKAIPITRSIYKGTKYELSFFTYAPSASEGTGKYFISCNPMLFLQKVIKNYTAYTPDQLQRMRYRITPKNFYTTIVFFNEVINWFYDPNMKDLFLRREDNSIIFNGDYNNLSRVTRRGYFENDVMKAMPAVVADYNGGMTEGIHLYINQRENEIDMSLDELEHLFGILKEFNFNAEVSQSLLALLYTEKLNNGTIPQMVQTTRY